MTWACGVQEHHQHIQLLIDLAAQPEPNDHIFGQAIALLLHWSRLMGTGQMPLEDASLIQQALNRQAVVPTLKGRWISVADGVVIRDGSWAKPLMLSQSTFCGSAKPRSQRSSGIALTPWLRVLRCVFFSIAWALSSI